MADDEDDGGGIPVEHFFDGHGDLAFRLTCPRCGEDVVLSNPWVEEECRCRSWRLRATAVPSRRDEDDPA